MRDDELARWLALREAADAASRSERVTRMVIEAIGPRDPIRVVDLGTGTGSNIRYLMSRLDSSRQRWTAIDRSETLLAQLPGRVAEATKGRAIEVVVETREQDLATLPAAQVVGEPHLITASALLDLVSESWIRSLASLCRDRGAAGLFAITYNGRSSCAPVEPEDALVLELFNRHQRTDKGLGGIAAGPDAVSCVVQAFKDAGYHVHQEPSDWTIGSEEKEFQRQLIHGWAEASSEIEPGAASLIARWRDRRLQHVDAGRSSLVVGHDDVGAFTHP